MLSCDDWENREILKAFRLASRLINPKLDRFAAVYASYLGGLSAHGNILNCYRVRKRSFPPLSIADVCELAFPHLLLGIW